MKKKPLLLRRIRFNSENTPVLFESNNVSGGARTYEKCEEYTYNPDGKLCDWFIEKYDDNNNRISLDAGAMPVDVT